MFNPNPYGYMPPQQIIRVNGHAGAQTLNLPPNSSALVLDETAPLVWLCKTDGAGYKSCMPFRITEYKPDPPVDVNALSARIDRLEAMISESDNRCYGSADNAEYIAPKRAGNVSSIQNGGKSKRVRTADDAEEPDLTADRE